MSRIIKKGATSQSVYFEVLDSTSTTGGRKTGLAYNTASLTAYYARNGGAATSITLATLAAANSAYSSGGFKEVDATNMPGVYRLDVPDAAFASGADSVVVTIRGATGMVQASAEIQLVAVDLQDAVRGGMTALPNANAEAAGGLYTRGTGAGQIAQQANGQIDVNLSTIKTQTVTCSAGVTVGAFVGNGTAALAVNASGRVDVGGWMGLVPNALASGRVDATVGAMQTDTLTAAALATDAVTEIKNAIFAGGSIDGYTLEQSQRLILSAAVGKVSGGGTGTIVVRAANDSKDRITATGDSNGNRFTVTLDAA